MKITTFETEAEWLGARRAKITGSRLRDIVVKRGTGKKKGFYELIAERIGLPPDQENAMERGHRLEPEAIDRYEQKTGKQVDRSLTIWTHDVNDNIAVSPDGKIVGENRATEVKCLNNANHIEAYLTKQVPEEYHLQTIQYFIVNEALEALDVCFYDPRLKVIDFFILTINRDDILAEIEEMFIYEKTTLKEVDEIVDSLLTF